MEIGTSEHLFNNPVHPYSKALLSAVPKSHPLEEKKRIILQGDVPSPANPPIGCKFHTRCPYVKKECKEIAPVMKEVEKGHFVSCHLV